MIILNINGILLNDEANDDIKNDIKKELENIKKINITKIKVIKMSSYFSVFLQIDVNDNLKIKEFIKLQNKIKKILRKNKLIKYIDIEPV